MTDITGEIATFVSGETYGQAISISESIVPRNLLEGLGSTITGTVFPASVDRERESRANIRSIYTIHLAVMKRLETDDDSEVQGLMDLTEEIAVSLDGLVTTSGRMNGVRIDPIFDFDRLSENNVFTSFIQMEVRGR